MGRGTCWADSWGGSGQGSFARLRAGYKHTPRFQGPKGVGKQQENGKLRKVPLWRIAVLKTARGPEGLCSPSLPTSASGSPHPEPLDAHAQRPLPVPSGKTKTLWSRYQIGDTSAVC